MSWFGNSGQYLEQSTFPRPVAPDDSEYFALFYIKRDILERPKCVRRFCSSIAIHPNHRLYARNDVIAKGAIGFLVTTNPVLLGKATDPDCYFAHVYRFPL